MKLLVVKEKILSQEVQQKQYMVAEVTAAKEWQLALPQGLLVK
jgi:hypothetical protein